MKHLPSSKGQSFQQPDTSATSAGYPVQNHGLQAAALNLPGRELRRTRKKRRISLMTLAVYLVVLIALSAICIRCFT